MMERIENAVVTYVGKSKNSLRKQLFKTFHSRKRTYLREKYSPKMKNLVCYSLKQGLSDIEIAKLTNVSPITISRWSKNTPKNKILKMNPSEINNHKVPYRKKCKDTCDSHENFIRVLPVRGENSDDSVYRPIFIFKLGKLRIELNLRWGR